MIELNKLAKPYNPCEEVLGEAFFFMKNTMLFGKAGYMTNPPADCKKHVVAYCLPAQGHTIRLTLKASGWEENYLINTPGFSQYTKSGNMLLLTSLSARFQAFKQANEICKFLNLKVDQDEAAVGIHNIVVDGATMEKGVLTFHGNPAPLGIDEEVEDEDYDEEEE